MSIRGIQGLLEVYLLSPLMKNTWHMVDTKDLMTLFKVLKPYLADLGPHVERGQVLRLQEVRKLLPLPVRHCLEAGGTLVQG